MALFCLTLDFSPSQLGSFPGSGRPLMGLYSRLSVILGFAVAMLAVAATATSAYRNAENLIEASRWVSHTDEIRSELHATLADVTESETAQRGFTITGDEAYLQQLTSVQDRLPVHIRNLRDLTESNPVEQSRIHGLERAVQKKQQWQWLVIRTRKEAGSEAAHAMVASGDGRALMTKVQQIVNEMQTEEEQALTRRSENAQASAARTLHTVSLFSWMVMLFLAIGSILVLLDLHAREKSQAALQEAQRQLQAALNAEAELARLDPLTNVANRRAFYEALDGERARSLRHGHALTLVYLDLDNFKWVNDAHGHAEGDTVLKVVSQVLAENVRRSDTVARMGGDEFALLLPETGFPSAEAVLRKLKSRLLAAMSEKKWPVTFSMGAMTFLRFPESSDQMLHAADHLLYQVKTQGKNSFAVQVFSEQRQATASAAAAAAN